MEISVRHSYKFNNEQIEEMAEQIKECFLEIVTDNMKVYDTSLIDKDDLDNLFEAVLDRINFNED